MAVNIFDNNAGVYKGDIVLFLDTLKVSTIETAAETTDATGGWGNPKLISWDYGKTITVTLEDALMSLESLRFMLGGAIKRSSAGQEVWIHHSEEAVLDDDGTIDTNGVKHHLFTSKSLTPTAYEGRPIRILNLTQGWRTQIKCGKDFSNTSDARIAGTSSSTSLALENTSTIWFHNPVLIDKLTTQVPGGTDGQQQTTYEAKKGKKGDRIRIFWDEKADSKAGFDAVEVTISPSTFPGQYRVVGDTFIRNQKTGADEPFQFVINNAKVQSNVTLTLQAEGDPTTFSMTLEVLRDDAGGGDMMSLIRYNMENTGTNALDDIGSLNTDFSVNTSGEVSTTVNDSNA